MSTALAHMNDQWLTHMDERKLVGAVLIDFTAAFDLIDDSILFAKLKCWLDGFSPLALTWMKSYICGRAQQVTFNSIFFWQ